MAPLPMRCEIEGANTWAPKRHLHSSHAIVGDQDLTYHALSLPLLDIAGQRIQIHRLEVKLAAEA